MLEITGYEELRDLIVEFAQGQVNREKNTYLATVVSLEPFTINNNYFGNLETSQLSILDSVKRSLTTQYTESSGKEKHKHEILDNPFKVGDILLIMLYQQEFEQRFIIIDKVVAYG